MHTERLMLSDIELSERPRTRIEEQRRMSRKALRLVAQIRLPNDTVLHGRTADISRGGIGFFCPERIEIGRDCTLMIDIAACGTSAELKLIGRVCHCTKQSEDCYRVGMQFIRMDEATAAILCTALR
jgi:c-di-GMP-binding flagellar brake protein YcgR